MSQTIRRALWSLSTLLFLAPAYGQVSPTPFKTLVGFWKVTVTADGLPSFRAFNQFNADGSSIEFDNSNPPGQQTIAAGPWERTGNKQYSMLEVNQLFDDQGYAGELRVLAKITLDTSGDTFTSTFNFQVLDPSDNIVFQGTGTAKGTRITIDSISRLLT